MKIIFLCMRNTRFFLCNIVGAFILHCSEHVVIRAVLVISGYVRRTTSRFIPEVNCVGPNLTINRPGLNNGKPTTIQTDGSQGEHSTEIK